jgi:hypothetical protein
MRRGPIMPSIGFDPSMGRTGNGVSGSGIIGYGTARLGGITGPPDSDPYIGRRTPEQNRAYVRALEAERDERCAEGDEHGVKLCEQELVRAGVEPEPTVTDGARPWWRRLRRGW